MSVVENPLVSVLMTAYNREKYIGEAIDSVLASTYKNFELIIVDDGSRDNTVGIVRNYANKDSRVKVFENKTNLGDYPNRNQAASYATGKYLKYVDADDSIYPWGLELLVQMMERFPDAGWGICSLEQAKDRPFPFELTPAQAYEYHYLGKGSLFHRAPLSSIIKKKCFDAVGGFKPIRMAGDFEMWHRMAQSYNVVAMPKGIIWYRQHDEQEMAEYSNFLTTYWGIALNYLTDLKCPLDQKIRSRVILDLKKIIRRSLVGNLMRFQFGPMIKKMRLLMGPH